MSKILKSFQVNIGNKYSVEAPKYQEKQRQIPDENSIENHVEDADKQPWQIEADNILLQANTMANDIIAEAEKQAEAIKEQASRQGYNAGKTEYDSVIAEVQQIKNKALTEYKQILDNAEQDIIELVIAISAKILGNEIEIDRAKIVHVVGEALKKCILTDSVVIRVSNEDCDLLNQNIYKLRQCVPGLEHIEIKAEAGFTQGKCLIETQFGNIEAGIDVQLEQIRHAFKQLLI